MMQVNEHSPYRCGFCKKPLNPQALGVMIRVTGWINSSRTGTVRGAGHATNYAHKVCLDLALKGHDPNVSQGTLL